MRKHPFLVEIAAAGIILLVAHCLWAVEIRSVKILDTLRTARTNFSSTENVTFTADTYTADASARITFTFIVYDPAGAQVFRQTGNSIPGSVGGGGSEVGNVAISRFYTRPGNYVLEASAAPATGAPVSQRLTFAVYSPIIILSYPSNGARDLADQPLMFRWIASGASKYRLSVGDNPAFYNPLLTTETSDTSCTYPDNPTDPRQKLTSGKEYYWKVEGLDVYGNIVAQAPTAFSFTMKQSATASSTRDIAIVSIAPAADSVPPKLNINVGVQNKGGSSESNITVTLYVAGRSAGSQRLDLLNPAETKYLTFTADLPDVVQGQPLFVSAAHNLFDDNVQNNMLTIPLTLSDAYFKTGNAKILGRITIQSDKQDEGAGIENIRITYSGTRSGEALSGPGGQYKIEDLPEGSYTLKVADPAYEQQEKNVAVDKGKAYPNIDFALVKRKTAEYSLSGVWEIIQPHLSRELVTALDGYDLNDISGLDKEELNALVGQLKENKAKVIEASISDAGK